MVYRINPDRNLPWNGLPELPIEKEYYHTLEIYEQLVDAKAAISRLQGRSAAIPNQGLLINTISLQEAKASSAIENIFTTDDELYKAYSDQTSQKLQGAPKEILHYREALWEGHWFMDGKDEFDLSYFELMYRKITGNNDGLRKPVAQTYIRQGGSGPNAGKSVYTPPRGAGVLEGKLDNLLTFINEPANGEIDPLIRMAIAHFQFEAVHPFRDGNGRTGRIFNIHFLVKLGLLDYPILFLSRYIMEHKEEYYSALAGVTQRGAWKNWILYLLRAVEVTSNDTYYKITDIISSKEASFTAISSNAGIRRPELLINIIFTQPFTKVSHFVEKGYFSEKTARTYLNKLVEIGVLERREIGGHHYYLNLELYRILAN